MKCEEVRKYIYPLLDNELDTEKNLEVLSHLNVCDRCQERFEGEQRYLENLSESLSSKTAPDSLRANVKQELAEQLKSRSWIERLGSKLRNGLPVAAAAVFLFAIGLVTYMNFFLNQGTSPQSMVRYLPEINQKIVKDNMEEIREHGSEDPFYDMEEMQQKLAEKFPALRNNLALPDLGEYRCRIIGGKVMEKGMEQIKEPFFYTLYCVDPGKDHKLVTHMVLKRSWFSPKKLQLSGDRIHRSGKFTVVEVPNSSSRLVYWGNKEYVCTFISDELDRDTLIKFAREARKQSISFQRKQREVQ